MKRYLLGFFLLMSVALAACAPQVTPPTQVINPVAETPTLAAPTVTETTQPPTETPAPRPAGWPLYTLAAQLPEAPAQVRLYQQAFPAALPTGERLAALLKQLQITGKAETSTGEDGGPMLSVTGGPVEMRLWADDPLIMVLSNATPAQVTPVKMIAPDARAAAAKAFLDARNLLDFPHYMEPSALSRERDQSIRVVPLIDGIPLHDYDALNGRLLLWFDSAGEVSSVFWRPLKLVAGENVEIIPAAQAWQQLMSGETPKKTGMGQCWQASVYDASIPYGTAEIVSRDAACVSWGGSGNNQPYTAATITAVKLVYFTIDLSLGMSPFAFPAESPARAVYPMWQFSGSTADKRELLVLWPAMK